ncbi:HK97 family phage prohead protease [Microbaculum marinisediminis]|uniref:HK97 family phage prohead protease n=1 Tax=Microbaculum marinisediminis TaxID=2931392 RepID=A0AAW5QVQ2_9HYPH|nr:HK97 family phage prohead protease [Microbaculum sp. A6E488]MCT8970591.1 HK97 family phage prohead protease [Microbaculum sp. A6E488]
MSKTILLPPMLRDALVRAESFDEESNTVDVVFTTGATVRRVSWREGEFDEELIVTPDAVRLDRLNTGAPFLDTHDGWSLRTVLGSVVKDSARIANGVGTAKILLTRRQEAEGTIRDIRDGIINNISVGYRTHRVEIAERDGQVPLHRAIDWEPYEISAVPIPADPGAHFRAGGDEHVTLQPCEFISRDAGALTRAARAQIEMRNRRLGL